MYDLVYLYRRYGDDEDHLKFSIRSANKNLPHRNLVIVGDLPKFINEEKITYLPGPFEGGRSPNIKAKLKKVIKDERISQDFYLMNDDFYILKPYNIFPYYHCRKLMWWWQDTERKNFITRGWLDRIEGLIDEFPNGYWYELHCPILYNKKRIRELARAFSMKKVLSLRTRYCNYFNVASQHTKDYKAYTLEEFIKYKDAPWLSSSDDVEKSQSFKSFMGQMFPRKSKYEKKT